MTDFSFELLSELSVEEKEQVVKLFTASFNMNEDAGLAYFNDFIDDGRKKIYGIVRSPKTKIAGAICILKKTVTYFGVSLNVVGMSYMATDSAYKSFLVRNLLVEGLFKYANKEADILLGFARKKMDGFWYQFGFLGFTNFGKVSVGFKNLPEMDMSLHLDICKEIDLPELVVLYTTTYTNLLISLDRTSADWKYIYTKAQKSGKCFELIKDTKQKIVGYLVRDKQVIEDMAVWESVIDETLSLLHRTIKKEEPEATHIEFCIGINHPVCRFIAARYPYSIHTRFVWNGGHIVKVNELGCFLKKITPVLEKRLVEVDIEKFDFSIEHIQFRMIAKKLTINLLQGHDNFNIGQMLFWQKLIFGVVSAEDLCRNSFVSKQDLLMLQIMFPFLQPQTPAPDQF